MGILCAALGRTLAVCPKDSWREPLILWHADIRESGDGKTAPAWALLRLFQEAQAAEHERVRRQEEDWRALDKKDREAISPPLPARSYFVTDLTLEGLRADLEGHPTGGTVIMLSELSSFVSAQNQYKKGGNDRESWLCLHDGNTARVVRAGRTLLITGARPQVLGGIQPAIFAAVFGGDGGQYLEDGTIFRFLLTAEPSHHYPLTGEAWTGTNRAAWEAVLSRALDFANRQAGTPVAVRLSDDALDLFLAWRNGLDIRKPELPRAFRGFLPKAYGYALRLAGALHAMARFARGEDPLPVMGPEDLRLGLASVEFYLGQAVDALHVLLGDSQAKPREASARTQRLVAVLSTLRGEVDSGRLAVGYVFDRFNDGLPPEERFASPQSFGAFLRSLGLTLTAGKHNANGRRGVHCLVWETHLENVLTESPPSPTYPSIQAESDMTGATQEAEPSAATATPEWPIQAADDQAESSSTWSAPNTPRASWESGLGGQLGPLLTPAAQGARVNTSGA